MPEICVIGHITKDHVITANSEKYMPGGTAYYFSIALSKLTDNFELITAVGKEEIGVVHELKNQGIAIESLTSDFSAYFQNIYEENQDNREQNVLSKAQSFTVSNVNTRNYNYIHLGPLLNDDISLELILELSQKGKISLDIQGFLRYVKNNKVEYSDWKEKKKGLSMVHTLKANEKEAAIITGENRPQMAAKALARLGVKEVIITLGGLGSLVYTKGKFQNIPAYLPSQVVDATGCGDTYMAGYLYKRNQGAGVLESGKFGAAMAAIKIQSFGPFIENENQINSLINKEAMVSPNSLD